MKNVVLICLLSIALHATDESLKEITRIEGIIKDVSTMRQQLDACVVALDKEKKQHATTQQQNRVATATQQNTLQSYNALKKRYESLETKYDLLVVKYESLKKRALVMKESEANRPCKQQKKRIVKPAKQDNPFPTLIMDENLNYLDVTTFTPSSFRTNKRCKIFDRPNGNVVEFWEDGRSFTAFSGTKTHIKISGYFVNKVWQSAKHKSFWIRRADAYQR